MVKEGDVIEGVITSIGKSFILVNVGLKSEGEIPVQQFPNAASLEVGSKVSVYKTAKNYLEPCLALPTITPKAKKDVKDFINKKKNVNTKFALKASKSRILKKKRIRA